MKKYYPFFFLCWLCSGLLDASPQTSFTDGNNAFYEGNYKEAIRNYEEALKELHSANLHYNLANAYSLSGELPKAILHYRRAHLLDPNDPDIQANFKKALNKMNIQYEQEDLLTRFSCILTVNTWSWILVVSAWCTFLGILSVRFLSPAKRRAVISISVLALIVILMSVTGLYGWHLHKEDAVIMHNDTVLKVAPTKQSPSKQNLQGGAIVTILEAYADYFRVQSDKDTIGWVAQQQCERIIPLNKF